MSVQNHVIHDESSSSEVFTSEPSLSESEFSASTKSKPIRTTPAMSPVHVHQHAAATVHINHCGAASLTGKPYDSETLSLQNLKDWDTSAALIDAVASMSGPRGWRDARRDRCFVSAPRKLGWHIGLRG